MAFGVVDHFTFEQVDVADEFAHQAAGRRLVDVHRRADLGDPAQVHDGDALGHGHGLFLVVGHHHAGHANALDDLHQFQLHLRTQFLVQCTHRLVEQQQLGALGQRAGQGHALALAAGQLVRLALGVLGHVHQLEHLGHAGVDLGLGHLVLLQAEGDVLRHGHVREQRVGLEHHVDRPLVGRHVGDVDAIEEDPPFGRAFEAGQHAQQGGLAGTGAPQKSEDLALADFQGHIVHGYRFRRTFFRDPGRS
ncbi:hypothetical protein PPS11_21719 [Pseudomonas putida S11]|nr:hypothetical protein PPS11_21719 [Pseudomonas putida S11]